MLLYAYVCRFDAFTEEIDVANHLMLREQGVVNAGMQKWLDQKDREYNSALVVLQKGLKLVSTFYIY